MGTKMGRGRVIDANWPGSTTFSHNGVQHPRGERELVHHIARATAHGEKVRAIGAGHSLNSIADTVGTFVTLDHYRGFVNLDRATGDATLRAGTRLWEIGPLLAKHGRALAVMGDIDRQSIAGAISTGTHGTGARYTGFSAMVTGLRIALANGDVLWCDHDRNARLFEAARLGLGALGIITEVRIRTVELYRLQRKEYSTDTDTAVESFLDEGDKHDHCELFWSPQGKRAVVRELNHVPADTPRKMPSKPRRLVQSELVGNGAFALANGVVRKVPKLRGAASAGVSTLMPSSQAVGAPHEIFTEPRRVKFRESEMAIPADRFVEAFGALRSVLENLNSHLIFPLEIRRVKADDVWLSGAFDRDSVYIAAHVPVAEPDDSFLRTVHDVLAGYDGRPHWGKQHWLAYDHMSTVYPMLDDFRSVRDEVDPARLFSNEYVERCLEPAS